MKAAGLGNLLITGAPGSGKTTLVVKLCQALRDVHAAGFYTEEIREQGSRRGFALVDLQGRRGVLSHVGIKSRCRVGRYGVDVVAFEAFLEGIPFLAPQTELIVIDEIGKMECFSNRFRQLLPEILASAKPAVATIARRGEGLIAQIKARSDVTVRTLTPANRNSLVAEILQILR
jgi:nucleoside-triphosphatase